MDLSTHIILSFSALSSFAFAADMPATLQSSQAKAGPDWISRTLTLNEACKSNTHSQCHQATLRGLNDDGLFVRDHALRLLLSNKTLSEELKKAEILKVIEDKRNYRNQVPLWIVKRAETYLQTGSVK